MIAEGRSWKTVPSFPPVTCSSLLTAQSIPSRILSSPPSSYKFKPKYYPNSQNTILYSLFSILNSTHPIHIISCKVVALAPKLTSLEHAHALCLIPITLCFSPTNLIITNTITNILTTTLPIPLPLLLLPPLLIALSLSVLLPRV